VNLAKLNPDFLKLGPTMLFIVEIPSSGAAKATLSDQSSSIGSGDSTQAKMSLAISARPANVTNVGTRNLITERACRWR
jgi:hypothetical protein